MDRRGMMSMLSLLTLDHSCHFEEFWYCLWIVG
jgi:hypothetical protein